jgi:uncharacterized protein YkwD
MAGRRVAWTVAAGVAFAAAAGMADDRREAELEQRFATDVALRAADAFGLELRSDPALAEVARELASMHANGVEIDTHEFVRQAGSARGVLDPFPYVFFGSSPATRLGELQRELIANVRRMSIEERRLYTHIACGLVPSPRRSFIGARRLHLAVLMTQRALSFAPLPAEPRPGDRILFDGVVHAPFREPQVFVTWPDGQAAELENLALEPGRFRAWIRLDRGAGEYQVEVLGRYDLGPRVLGLCSVYARGAGEATPHERFVAAARRGEAPRRRPTPAPASGTQTVAEAEDRLFQLVNRDRVRAGLARLAPDSDLATMARAHSLDMCDNGFFAHVSPRTGRLVERAERTSLRFSRLAENIAVHRDVDEAEAALLRSPGHRKNILDPEFTHLGVGVAFATDSDGQRRVYVTQNFMIPAP